MNKNEKDKKETNKKKKEVVIEVPPIEAVSLDVDEHPVEPSAYDAETTIDLLEDALEEEYMDDVTSHAETADTAISFANRQKLKAEKSELQEKLQKHQSESPTLSGGDIDAAWDQANDAGTETVGGTAPTPGQNDIDQMGKAMGISQERNKPLNISEKRKKKDEARWELDPRSAEENEDAS